MVVLRLCKVNTAAEEWLSPPVPQEALSPVVATNAGVSLDVDSEAPTLSESESDAESAFSSDSDADSVASRDSLDGAAAVEQCFSGPWLLNIRSGVFHKSIRSVTENSHMLACRPQTELHDGYELRNSNPRFEGFSACRHLLVVEDIRARRAVEQCGEGCKAGQLGSVRKC